MDEEKIEYLYKYRPLYTEKNGIPIFNKNTLSLLNKGELYFSSPINFNDPYDSWLPILPDEMTEEMLIQLLHSTLDEDKEAARNLRKRIRERAGGDLKRFISIKKEELKNREYLKQYFHDMNNNVLKEFLICCFSKNYNNILMWSHYSLNHTGICIGIKLDSNSNVAFAPNELGFSALPPKEVIYSEDNKKLPSIYNKDVNQENLFKFFCYKAKYWSYEDEYRLIIPLKATRNSNILNLKKNSIAEILFGLKVPDEVIKNTLIKIENSKFLDLNSVKFYKMKDKTGYYEVEKEEINPKDYI